MIENLGRNSKKILKPLNTIEGIVYEFLEPLEGRGTTCFSDHLPTPKCKHNLWKLPNFKNIFSRPLFIIIFKPKMVNFHSYSILC